ncbi:MAG: ATP-binding protein [Oscillospiraceae bacterium]
MFDRFYRPDASRTAATGGFGIGLSIAKSIAEAHHGTIRASVQESRITFAAELK